MTGRARKLVSMLVSAALLGAIYGRIDAGAMLAVFRGSSPGWLFASLAMVVPLTLLTAYRLQWLVPPRPRLPLRDATSLTLSANVLNLVLPSKMGDLAKSVFLREHGSMGGSAALAVVVYEKAWDMASLLAWCALGLLLHGATGPLYAVLAATVAVGFATLAAALLSRRASALGFRGLRSLAPAGLAGRIARVREGWEGAQERFLAHPRRRWTVVAVSLVIWLLHLVQIWMFTLALRTPVPFLANLGLAPLAILAGLLPLTFAGVGTRDAALILFYADHLAAPAAAALGVLCTLRYVLPALGGLPFLARHLRELRRGRDAADAGLIGGPA